jgi:phosphoglycerate kinase
MRKITDIKDLKGKRVLVRLDLNVPLDGDTVTDEYRIDKAFPTINYLIENGAKIIIISHIGREKTDTLKPVFKILDKELNIKFIDDPFEDSVSNEVENLSEGEVLMFENLRKWEGETDNDEKFAEELSKYADIFINDAFSVSHREHASIVGLPKLLPSYLGFQIVHEIENLQKAFEPEHPFVFILGGAKVETKLPLLLKFIDKADYLFVGGVLANDFFKVQNKEIGKSITSDSDAPADIVGKIKLPHDVFVLRKGRKIEVYLDDVQSEDSIFDSGSRTAEELSEKIWKAKLIIWNGPLGYCEKGFCDSTLQTARAVAESKAFSIVGGGDSLAAIPDDVQKQFSFVSTGGGAMLEYLANGTLPGIEAIN